ncbi:hypothetical protein LSM04_009686 [Trypanosoma melophagium]|uniref:uncharacterized protein n=1 Tax=Trypanosoma melophagium TaxID=715481 RepID=UPI00351A3CAC|nr:hypothetical protein LSM04_009686 [Trypanosoma melophagium]
MSATNEELGVDLNRDKDSNKLMPTKHDDLSADEKHLSSQRGLSTDEKRAGLIFLGCFLFQEVDNDVFRGLLIASITAYTMAKRFMTHS